MYDDEKTDLLKHWDNTYKYITKARNDGSKVLVHCKMGVSRSASVVIAYAMKAYDWDFQKALKHVKEKRNCIKPNNSFISQLETYQGILDAMKNKEKLQRSKSETNLKSPVQIKNEGIVTDTELPPVTELSNNNVETLASGQDLRQIGVRPKSWSPDISLSITDPQNVFLSLENLNQRSVSKDKSLKSLRQKCLEKNQNRNMLLPCDNGESYSVSPNQIRHLPGHCDNEHTSVKDRVNELEHKSINKKKLVLNVIPKTDSESNKSNDGMKVLGNCGESNLSAATVGTIVAVANVAPIAAAAPPIDSVDKVLKNETWDPGEKFNNNNNCTKNDIVCDYQQNNNNNIVSDKTDSNSSASLKLRVPDCAKSKTLPSSKNGDMFSNQLDRVFDREERKQQRMSVPTLPTDFTNDDLLRDCPSRQNSWSSYDSAVVLGYQGESRETPSRHSSWGSGDTRALPSRNSSFGSYDMRQSGSTGYVNEKGEKTVTSDVDISTAGMFPYDKEEIPWYPGTVKRTKQKLEECAGKKDLSTNDLFKSNSSDTLTSDYPASVASHEQTIEAFNNVLIKSYNEDNTITRITSLPSAINNKSTQGMISRLSVSAPVSSSMDLVPKERSLSRSVSNVSSLTNHNSSTVRRCKTFLESTTNNAILTKKLLPVEQNMSGLVRSRKKEFEAKQIDINNKNRVNSLPSSPISVHVDKEIKEDVSTSSDPGEDMKLKQLIGKFEYGSTDKNNADFQVNLRQKPNKSFLKNSRNSYVDITDKKINITQTPLISNLNKTVENDLKRPPMAPVVRNTQTNVNTVITKAKKQQQYGKSHPLARLNIKPRHNNPVYNTM